MGTFHIIFVILFSALIAIRLRFHFKARTWSREGRTSEGVSLFLRFFVGVPLIICILVYPFRPQILEWASIPLDPMWRWIGAAIFGLSLPLLIWVQQALGKNFSTDLRIRTGHTLVTWGPYRHVRHPMYTVLLLTFTGMGLLSANWFIGSAGIIVLIVIMVSRTPKEEAMMADAFGQSYKRYAETTGRYIPRLRPNRSSKHT